MILLRLTHVLHVLCLLNQGAHCPTHLPGEKCLFWCSILYQTFLLQSFSQSCLVSPSMPILLLAQPWLIVIGRTPVRQRNSRSCLTVAWQLDLTWPDVTWWVEDLSKWSMVEHAGATVAKVATLVMSFGPWYPALPKMSRMSEHPTWRSSCILYIVSCKIYCNIYIYNISFYWWPYASICHQGSRPFCGMSWGQDLHAH